MYDIKVYRNTVTILFTVKLLFTETQKNLEQDVERIKRWFHFFSLLFSNNENQFIILALDLQNYVRIEKSENYSAISVITLKNTAFKLVPLTVLLMHMSKKQSLTDFHKYLQNVVDSKSLGVVAGDIKVYLCDCKIY